jgi:hypothetical protein
MTLAKAYESGISRFAPPPMPVGRVPMMKSMVIGMGIVTVGSFFIIVLLGSISLPEVVRIIQVVITLIGIVVALVLSIIAFQRVGRGDLNSQQLLPAWDRALENWSRLRYCKRDNIVFDPQQASPKALSDDELASLLAVESQHKEPAQMSSPMTAHQ